MRLVGLQCVILVFPNHIYLLVGKLANFKDCELMHCFQLDIEKGMYVVDDTYYNIFCLIDFAMQKHLDKAE